jgi:integrase
VLRVVTRGRQRSRGQHKVDGRRSRAGQLWRSPRHPVDVGHARLAQRAGAVRPDRQYSAAVSAAARRYLIPTLGSLLIGELTVAAIERRSSRSDPGIDRSPRAPRDERYRACATAQCDTARCGSTRYRGTRPIACPRRRVRALTVGEAADLQVRLRADPTAVRLDLPDFVEFMLGTGVRVGKACAIREAVLDLNARTVHINATVVRVNGAGLQIQPRTKTAGSEPILHLPPYLVRVIKQCRLAGHSPGPSG